MAATRDEGEMSEQTINSAGDLGTYPPTVKTGLGTKS